MSLNKREFILITIKNSVLVVFLVAVTSLPAYANKTSVGWVEDVLVNGSQNPITAKIDTGADNSSINAKNVKVFQKDDKRWVRFTVVNRYGQNIDIEKPVVKQARIKTKDGRFQDRDVIELNVCLQNVEKTVPVNMVDRSHFNYQMLIGRSFLQRDFLVDASSKFLHEPHCNQGLIANQTSF